MGKSGKILRMAVAAGMVAAGGLCASAQSGKGTITPVESDDNAPAKPTLHYYDKHGNKLEKPVLYLATLDTVSKVRASSPYPLYNGITAGVNFADAIMGLIGQKHSSYDVSAMVSLHNWFFPVVEAGIGWGRYSDLNGLYKVKAYPTMYAKVGINYNFLYKSDPAYMAYIGLRLGVSQCRWDRTDIRKPTEDEQPSTDETATRQDDTQPPSEIPAIEYLPNEMNQRCTSIYGEVLAGLKVKIAGPFSLGWNVRYRLGLHSSGGQSPWFVPGYGTGPIGFTFNAYWTFGEKRKKTIELPEEIPERAEGADTETNITSE